MEIRKNPSNNVIDWYVAGYLTAVNFHLDDTYNILGSSDIPSVLLWLEKYCGKEPLSNIQVGLALLVIELYPNRKVKAP